MKNPTRWSALARLLAFSQREMNCNILAGEQKAASDALSVSEYELQRIKQQGCFTSSQDRAIMRNPDYRALPYPQLANPILSLEFDPNSKYSAINQAEGFVSPFVDTVTNQVVQARPTVPGSSMAGTGDLAAIAGAYLENTPPLASSSVYARIADSIRGAPPRESESSPTRQGLSEAELHQLVEEETTAARYEPVQSAAQVTVDSLYGGASVPRPRPGNGEPLLSPASSPGFLAKCQLHCKGLLYDLLHYDKLSPDLLAEEACSSKMGYALTRQGRLPYLLTTLLFFLCVFYLLRLLMTG